MRQQFPGTSTPDCIEDAVEDFPSAVYGRASARFRHRDEWLQVFPFGVGRVSVVRLTARHSCSSAYETDPFQTRSMGSTNTCTSHLYDGRAIFSRKASQYETNSYRKHQRTAVMITSPGYWRTLNGLSEVIGIDSLTYQTTRFKPRNGTVSILRVSHWNTVGQRGYISQRASKSWAQRRQLASGTAQNIWITTRHWVCSTLSHTSAAA